MYNTRSAFHSYFLFTFLQNYDHDNFLYLYSFCFFLFLFILTKGKHQKILSSRTALQFLSKCVGGVCAAVGGRK